MIPANLIAIYKLFLDHLPYPLWIQKPDSTIIFINDLYEDMFHVTAEDIIGKTTIEVFPKELAQNYTSYFNKAVSTKQPYILESQINHSYIETHVFPLLDKKGELQGVAGIVMDITYKKSKQLEIEKLRYLSEIDILTGLYNRNSFEEKIKQFNTSQYHPLGIIMGDVNGLKLLNDTLGHLEGDKLLKSISHVLVSVCKESGYVFRFGGDEFIILLPNCDETQCEALIRQIQNDCKKQNYEYMQLSIALSEVVKYQIEEDIYDCIRNVESKVYRQKLLESKSIKSSIIESLMNGLAVKNLETNAHAQRVVDYALVLGRKLQFKIDELDELILVGKLHDIGKIGIREDILLKTTPLTEEEYDIMKTHSEKGYRIINASSELDTIAKCVLTHHEHWDGSGYPLGLSGNTIPLISRIIHIVDSYDVMTTDRPYKKALSKESAIAELKRCSGTQFDPLLVDYFIEYLET